MGVHRGLRGGESHPGRRGHASQGRGVSGPHTSSSVTGEHRGRGPRRRSGERALRHLSRALSRRSSDAASRPAGPSWPPRRHALRARRPPLRFVPRARALRRPSPRLWRGCTDDRRDSALSTMSRTAGARLRPRLARRDARALGPLSRTPRAESLRRLPRSALAGVGAVSPRAASARHVTALWGSP